MSVTETGNQESAVTPEEIEGTPALNKDGTVRRKPGPKPGTKRGPRKAAAPGRASAPSKPRAGAVDYRAAIVGVAQIPQMVCGLAARFLKRDNLALDGIAIGIHAPVLADALNTTAQTEEGVARALDRLMQVGPYGAVVAAGLPLVMQILANHGLTQPNQSVGIYSPEELAEIAHQHATAAGVG